MTFAARRGAARGERAMRLYSHKDVDRKALKGARIAILGYGSQGRAHALNLKDSGCDVVVGVRKGGAGWRQARREGLEVAEPAQAVAGADLVAILIPDPVQKELYQSIRKGLKQGATLLFAHGFNVHFRQIRPRKDLDVVLIAPKGPGDLVRRQYVQGRGVPCLLAVAQDATGRAHARALAYAHGIGGTRGGVLETTFAEETETDLFGEQAVLCGGCTELVVKGFETLVEAGYQPEVAYYECLHELKLIVDLLHEGGLAKMHQFVSETAKYGDLTRGPRIVNERVKNEMRKVLKEVQSGRFARQWIRENATGRATYQKLLSEDVDRQIEKVGATLRARMPWLNEKRRA
ncbi:MAG: ketol-acid reductoisomerase [Gammaproteobacteria bacterium]|nr:ketol-acid reductoisomerase [Gammaproteobacteria bacterium]